MTGTEILRAEHKEITIMLEVAKLCSDKVKDGNLSEIETLLKITDFFKNFTDDCHHRKEEDLLFPLLKEKEHQADLLGNLLNEHVQGRNLIKAINSEAEMIKGGKTDTSSLIDNVRQYTTLLDKHIKEENDVLFKQAEKVLTAREQADLYEKFELLEKEEIGEGVHEQYHHLIHELAHRYGLL